MRGPWCHNEDDPEMDGEKLKGELVLMDEDYKNKLEREEHVLVPRRVYITREHLDEFGSTARSPGRMSLHRKGRSGPKANATVHGQSSRGPREANEKDSRGRKSTKGTRRNDRSEGMPVQESCRRSSSSGAMGASTSEDVEERNSTDKKRNADAEHAKDPERPDGPWMRADGIKRKADDEGTRRAG